jgi:hypothetical protein
MAKLGTIEDNIRIVTRVDHFNPPSLQNDPMGAAAFVRQFAARGMVSMQSVGDACFETVYAGAGGMGLYSYDGNYYGLPGRDIDGPRKFRE